MAASASFEPIPIETFSTTALRPEERHDVWMDHGGSGFARSFETVPLQPFDCSGQVLGLGETTLFQVDITSQRWERSPEVARRSAFDVMGVNIPLARGGARGAAGAREFEHGSGEALLFDLSQPSLHTGDEGRYLQMLIPRATAQQAGFDVRALHGVVLPEPATRLLRLHMSNICEMALDLTIDDTPLLNRTLLDLLMLGVMTTGRAERYKTATLASTLNLRARIEIDRSLGSPSLSVANLCRRLGVSRSTLHRAFEAQGGVQTYIRDRRLDAARAALLDIRCTERIATLAERLGFSDAGHLSRLFRGRFGIRPSECRAEARRSDERDTSRSMTTARRS